MALSLGVDLGNAKVKYCLLEGEGSEMPRARWHSYPLPMTTALLPDRSPDFERGLPATLMSFLESMETELDDIDCLVVTTSHFFAYPSFGHAHRHTIALFDALCPDRTRLLSADGTAYTLSTAARFTGKQVTRFAATKFWGSAYLASKFVSNGLSLDVGTMSTDLVPLREGGVDPTSDPDAYNLDRLRTERFLWLGMTSTPLDYLSREAVIGSERYFLYPRVASTDCLSALLELVPRELALRHTKRFPSRPEALLRLAQAFGLDVEILGEPALMGLAEDLYNQWIERLARAIGRLMPEASDATAAVMGLGRHRLLPDALARAGIPAERLLDLEALLGDELSSVSTAYGAALKGLEEALGRPIALLPSPATPTT